MAPSRLPSGLALMLLGVSVCLTCCHENPQPGLRKEEDPVSINLSTITRSDQTRTFTVVRQVSLLPAAVLNYFKVVGMANPGQAFNLSDIGSAATSPDHLPGTQLLVAAISKQYCIVSYIAGGFTVRYRMEIFDLSDGKAKVIFDGPGGDHTLHGLKETIESGAAHNELVSDQRARIAAAMATQRCRPPDQSYNPHILAYETGYFITTFGGSKPRYTEVPAVSLHDYLARLPRSVWRRGRAITISPLGDADADVNDPQAVRWNFERAQRICRNFGLDVEVRSSRCP